MLPELQRISKTETSFVHQNHLILPVPCSSHCRHIFDPPICSMIFCGSNIHDPPKKFRLTISLYIVRNFKFAKPKIMLAWPIRPVNEDNYSALRACAADLLRSS